MTALNHEGAFRLSVGDRINVGYNQKQTNASLREDWVFTNEFFREIWHELQGTSKKVYSRKSPEATPVADTPEKPLSGGRVAAPDAYRKGLSGNRFVFTYAQNNTDLHEDFWAALQHFCAVNNAQLGVAKGTYNKGAWANQGGITVDGNEEDEEEVWYDPRINPYVIRESVEVAKGLLFCAELDILPTAKNPLSSLEDYTGTNSGIIPHTKVQMKSLATMKHEDAKFLYTTGACTLRNYIERKAGQIATFHHVFGALYVEVDADGEWFARQLNASDDGTFFDLDRAYGPGWDRPASDFGRPLINLGDIHVEKMDHIALRGAIHMISTLNPDALFIHDLVDFENRNHHNLKDPYFLAEQHRKQGSVRNNMLAAANFLHTCSVMWPETDLNVIRSNHDQAFKRWLQEANGHFDPPNAQFWHSCNSQMYAAINEGVYDFDIFAWAMHRLTPRQGVDTRIRYIKEDESFVRYNIEFGMHGHRGPNGSRGNPAAYRQLGRRANTGHTHSAGIIDGIYTAGLLAKLDMGYNVGPSSWSHSHIITHPSGKRQIVTQRGSKWRAIG